MKAECKPGGLLDLALADVMGFTQEQMAEIFNTTRGAISKRVTSKDKETFAELKEIILREAAKEAGRLLAVQSYERIAERTDAFQVSLDEND